jgi:UDP-N-acetylglucosamine 2-epimerase
MPRILHIVGARPQFVKLAAVERAFQHSQQRVADVSTSILHTGQHYDDNMSRVFFQELGIPAPSVNLDVGSGLQGEQTARMLTAIEQHLQAARPDVVVVYGDTNSTLAGALAAAKLHIPLAHVEAGLRSFNRRMPEELNRILTDHAADLLLAPTKTAIANLTKEGLASRTTYSGDVMYDAVLHYADQARQRLSILRSLEMLGESYALATIHRAENTEPARLRILLTRLNEVARDRCTVLFPVHPRTRLVITNALDGWQAHPRLRLIEPLGYMDLLSVLQASSFVLTDSGGLQKEAAFLGRQCFTLRDETEWVETVELGVNVIVGSDASRLSGALVNFDAHRASSQDAQQRVAAMYGEGRAGVTVADAVIKLARESA